MPRPSRDTWRRPPPGGLPARELGQALRVAVRWRGLVLARPPPSSLTAGGGVWAPQLPRAPCPVPGGGSGDDARAWVRAGFSLLYKPWAGSLWLCRAGVGEALGPAECPHVRPPGPRVAKSRAQRRAVRDETGTWVSRAGNSARVPVRLCRTRPTAHVPESGLRPPDWPPRPPFQGRPEKDALPSPGRASRELSVGLRVCLCHGRPSCWLHACPSRAGTGSRVCPGASPWGPVCSPSRRSAAAICFQRTLRSSTRKEYSQPMEGDSGRGGVIGPLTLSFPADKAKGPGHEGRQGCLQGTSAETVSLGFVSLGAPPSTPLPPALRAGSRSQKRLLGAVAAPRAPTGCVWTPSPSPRSQPLAHFVTSL